MTKKQTEKRYIVTFVDSSTDQNSAASVLDISIDTIQDSVSLLATDAVLTASDVLHFDGLGAASLTLSATDADRFKNDKRVLAVEEDLEMYALHDDSEHWGENPFNSATQEELLAQSYQQGYQRGISDLYNKILADAKALHATQGSAATAITAPIVTSSQAVPWNITLLPFGSKIVPLASFQQGCWNPVPRMVVSGGLQIHIPVTGFQHPCWNDG